MAGQVHHKHFVITMLLDILLLETVVAYTPIWYEIGHATKPSDSRIFIVQNKLIISTCNDY